MAEKVSHYKTSSTIDAQAEVKLDPIVQFCKESWEDWDNHWGSKFSEFDSHYDRWIGKPPQRNEDWQAQFHKKLTWQAEKVLVARFHSALFPISAPIATDATEVTDELQGILSTSIVSHWFKIGKFSKEFLSGMRSAAIYGTGVFEDDWYQRVEKVYEKEEMEIPDYRPMVDEQRQPLLDEDGNVMSQEIGKKKVLREQAKNKVVEDRYRVRKANIYAWRIHPNKKSDDDDYPVMKQEFVTYDTLVERQSELQRYGIEKFTNMDKIEKDKTEVDKKSYDRIQKDSGFVDKKNSELELLHYWGKYGENKARWITIVNRKFLLQDIDNPNWHKKSPLTHIVWTEDERESYYGIGLAKIGGVAEDRANNNINIRIDERKKNIKGGGWYNALDKKIKKSQLMKNIPGLYKSCTDVNNAVRPDIVIPSTPDDYKEEEVSVNDHREITGATSSLMPTESKKNLPDTLGATQLVLGQSVQRLRPDLAMMEFMGIRRIANRAFLATRQFMSRTESIELIASEDQKRQMNLVKIYQLTPEKIMGQANFHCTGLSESIDKAQNIDKLLKYAEVTGKIPAMQNITNYQGIAKRVALWLGFENLEDLILLNPANPLAPQPQPQGVPGQMPGMPGQGIPGQPQAGGGLPPEILQSIAQQIGR